MDNDRREQLLNIRDYAEEEFDKLVIYLSSGGLVLTVGFVRDIVNVSSSSYSELLIITWIAFTISLITILISHRTSLKSIDLELNDRIQESDSWDIFTGWLNWSGMVAFMLGVISFLIFILINI